MTSLNTYPAIFHHVAHKSDSARSLRRSRCLSSQVSSSRLWLQSRPSAARSRGFQRWCITLTLKRALHLAVPCSMSASMRSRSLQPQQPWRASARARILRGLRGPYLATLGRPQRPLPSKEPAYEADMRDRDQLSYVSYGGIDRDYRPM